MKYLILIIVLQGFYPIQSCDPEVASDLFRQKVLINSFSNYTTNPYDNNSQEYQDRINQTLSNKQIVCAIQYKDDQKQSYILQTFDTKEIAEANGFIVTHQGRCGVCSTLQDLSVYLTTDLTRPVRKCGLDHPFSDEKLFNCIQSLGFTYPCSQIWLYNTKNTKKHCFKKCMWAYLARRPFVKPDGSLNDCLQCDEDISGPIFQYEAARTRRNSGIHSEIDRPSDQIYNMTHCYY